MKKNDLEAKEDEVMKFYHFFVDLSRSLNNKSNKKAPLQSGGAFNI
tara:strand:- start:1747 stop:1884 length:138 start_codon:yes stop_codon:yes gene_type:complete